MKIQHFIEIHFTGYLSLGFDKIDEWLRYRTQIMCDYTLSSLSQQTVRDFTVLIYCSEESRGKIEKYFAEFSCDVPDDIRFIFNRKFNCERSLNNNIDKVLCTRIDSDDMFRFNALEIIRDNYARGIEAIVPTNGYVYDNSNNGYFLYTTYRDSPPFYTICSDPGVWVDTHKYNEWLYRTKQISGHDSVRHKMASKMIENKIFMILVHKMNSSTSTNFKNDIIIFSKEKYRPILKEFGVDYYNDDIAYV